MTTVAPPKEVCYEGVPPPLYRHREDHRRPLSLWDLPAAGRGQAERRL